VQRNASEVYYAVVMFLHASSPALGSLSASWVRYWTSLARRPRMTGCIFPFLCCTAFIYARLLRLLIKLSLSLSLSFLQAGCDSSSLHQCLNGRASP